MADGVSGEELRELLTETLAERIGGARLVAYVNDQQRVGLSVVVDRLLPVVKRYAAQRAAEALREAAKLLWEPGGWLTGNNVELHARLLARADALAADHATEAGR